MEDKKVMDFINENYKKEHAKWVKQQKRKNRKENILILIGILAVLTGVLVFGSMIHHQTEKAIADCVKKGNDYYMCLRDAQ